MHSEARSVLVRPSLIVLKLKTYWPLVPVLTPESLPSMSAKGAPRNGTLL